MYIKVRISAGQRKEEVVQKSENSFEIKLKEKAERNMANKRLIEIIAEKFEVSISDVKIINGHHHPSKLLSVLVPDVEK